MVSLRLKQIIDLIEGREKFIENSIIIDSGCGPGRYTDVLSEYNPHKIIGIDSGKDIITENRKRFSKNHNIEMIHGFCDNLPLEDNSTDLVISAGVLHHLPDPMEKLIVEHARVIKENGYLFIFIAGKGGLELKIWEFMREFLKGIPINKLHKYFDGTVNPLRLQGLLDHGYGEYQQTDRTELEKWLKNHFREIKRVPGIEGLDVTEEIYANDIYFPYRFGTGNLRYLCRK
jgi:ubiquinone/menaquinone biosynthesis C-methylase UbiE